MVVLALIPFSIMPATPICDCFYYPNHLRAFRESKAVFIGEVTKVERHADRPDELATQVTHAVTFKVIKSWKGPKGHVRTWEDGFHTSCVKWKFEEGQKYLIYAESHHGVLVVNGYCSRTRQLETTDAEALKEFAELNSSEFLRKAQEVRRSDLDGTWQVVSYHFGDGVSVGPRDASKLLGMKIRFNSDRAVSGRDACTEPKYESKRMSAEEFLREFRTSLRSIGIKQRDVEVVNIRCDGEDWSVLGCTLFKTEKGRMLTTWDGVFFGLKKVNNRALKTE